MIKEIDYTYCPSCGSPFEKIPPNLLRCTKCNLHFYVNPKPTTAILLINTAGEILFVVRKIDPKKGMLDLPGGFVDINETLEEGMIREIDEELGVTIAVEKLTYLGSTVDEYEHGGIESRTINAMYTAPLSENVHIVPADYVASILWVDVNAIKYETIAFKGVATFMQSYFSSKV